MKFPSQYGRSINYLTQCKEDCPENCKDFDWIYEDSNDAGFKIIHPNIHKARIKCGKDGTII